MLADLCSKLENLKDALSYLESAINCSTTFEDVKNLILKHKTLELQIIHLNVATREIKCPVVLVSVGPLC